MRSVVCGASGQDGYFLVRRLLAEGGIVYAVVRDPVTLDRTSLPDIGELHVHAVDILHPEPLLAVIASTKPDEIYNLAGQSSVSQSFENPVETWRSNADFVVSLLDAVRRDSPETRLYQASSTDMFGAEAGERFYNERSRFSPQSPYASAKAAAHLACRAWRASFGVRVACGILSNHESHRRRPQFLTRKIVDHVRSLGEHRPDSSRSPLIVGNLKVERDWGFAPDYVDGMVRIIRQVVVRGAHLRIQEDDVAQNYRDYVLGTGQLTPVWRVIDRAFSLAGHELDWHLDNADPREWWASFRGTGTRAVVVDSALFRPSEPMVIAADARLAVEELGWQPRSEIDCFLRDMLDHAPTAARAVTTTDGRRPRSSALHNETT